MFNRFTKIIHNAVDALQPAQPLHQEFIGHWKAITTYFMQNKEHKTAIDQTGIPHHLDQMIIILLEEEELSETGSTASSMEYLLQHKILETLYTLARTDCPPGMKQQVLVFFTKLLSRIRQPLLPHVNVYRAVHRLIRVCGETKAAPSENEEIHFLCTICGKICQHQYLVNFFIEKSSVPDPGGTGDIDISSFGLIDALLSLMHSADGRVSVKACEGLLLCASLSEPSAILSVCKHTDMSTQLCNVLVDLYKKLDKQLLYHHYVHVPDVHAKWGLDIQSCSDDRQSFPGKRAVISFLSWLDYCDQLIMAANPTVANHFADKLREHFIIKCLKPDILQVSEVAAVVSTVILTHCINEVSSEVLIKLFISSLLDSESTEFTEHLIQRCDHLSEEISVVTLKLFEVLLQKPDSSIVDCLVISSLHSRAYFSSAPASPAHIPGSQTSSNDTQESPVHLINRTENSTHQDGNQSGSVSAHLDDAHDESALNTSTEPKSNISLPNIEDVSPNDPKNKENENVGQEKNTMDELSLSPPLSPSSSASSDSYPGVHQIVHCFLNMLPEEAKSSFQSSDSGYDTYLRDAFKQYSDVTSQCSAYDWPTDLPNPPDIDDAALYVESPFIRVLFDKLSHILDQGYDSNLQVTSVISQLALLPHPVLHEFLLNPYLSVHRGIRTLSSVIRKVIHDIEKRMNITPDFQKELLIVRKRLMGMDDSIRRIKTTPTPSGIEETRIYEGVIVLEEFCKELAAVVFVKHHAIT